MQENSFDPESEKNNLAVESSLINNIDALSEQQKKEVIKIIAASKISSPQKKLKLSAGTFFILLIGSMVGGGIGLSAGTTISDSLIDSVSNNGVITITNPEEVTWLAAAAIKATPSVVSIIAVSPGGDSAGSGIVYDTEGHIVTSAHLFQHSGYNLDQVSAEVRFSNGEVVSATLLNADLSLDLALLKINSMPETFDLVPAVWRDSDTVQVGEYVAAIGSPLDLFNSVTKGVISSNDRVIQLSRLTPDFSSALFLGSDPSSDEPITVRVFQTDAAINPGNSGGGLVDVSGNFIGLNAAISGSEGSRGLGFSIPGENVTRVMDNMIKNGASANGLLGAIAGNKFYDPEKYASFSEGALLIEISENSAAANAGIKNNFVVTSYNNIYKVTSSSDLVGLLRTVNAGETVQLSGYYLEDKDSIVSYTVILGSASSSR